ncbi:Boophilin-H2 [Varanus komodoensis]|nr:Boophilin-H2 [Varanus komodoensis]
MEEGMNSLLIKFADDTKSGAVATTEEQVLQIQKDLDRLWKWAGANRMAFNVDKCKVLHLGHRKGCHKYRLGDKRLESSTCERNLRVLVDCRLNMSQPCDAVVKRANATLGCIARGEGAGQGVRAPPEIGRSKAVALKEAAASSTPPVQVPLSACMWERARCRMAAALGLVGLSQEEAVVSDPPLRVQTVRQRRRGGDSAQPHDGRGRPSPGTFDPLGQPLRGVCTLPADGGLCFMLEERWYFDHEEKKCQPFSWGGCGGNENNFGSRPECESACSPYGKPRIDPRAEGRASREEAAESRGLSGQPPPRSGAPAMGAKGAGTTPKGSLRCRIQPWIWLTAGVGGSGRSTDGSKRPAF